jgi:hypothetical protein
VVVTKRDGKSFEGRSESSDGDLVLEFEGEVDGAGKLSLTITKIAKATDEFKKSLGARNIVGVKASGAVDGKSATWKWAQPYADNPKGAPRTGIVKLKLKE